MLTKAIPLVDFDLKEAGGERLFTAYASTFGNTDAGGDIVLKGAFTKSLQSRPFRPLLWQHQQHTPIGIEKSLREDGKGLVGTWQILHGGPADYAYECLKQGAVRAMSIGYQPVDAEPEGMAVRRLKEIDLLENSVVSLPMNESALITGVKRRFCPECGEDLAHPERHARGEESHARKDDDNDLTLPELDLDVSFEDLMAQVKGYLLIGVDEAEALHARRQSDQRELSEAHQAALHAFEDELKGLLPRVEAILRVAPIVAAPPEAKAEDSGLDALALRLELTRRRLRMAGHEV